MIAGASNTCLYVLGKCFATPGLLELRTVLEAVVVVQCVE